MRRGDVVVIADRAGGDYGGKPRPAVIVQSDVIVSAVDAPDARRAASIWALALLKPHLDVGVAVRPTGAEADLRLIPPGMGCIECLGGVGVARMSAAELRQGPAIDGKPNSSGDFRRQRLGSLRSFNVAAGHLGLRMIEQLYAGTLRCAVFRRIAETEQRGLVTRDLVFGRGAVGCEFCASLLGAGTLAAERRLSDIKN